MTNRTGLYAILECPCGIFDIPGKSEAARSESDL